MCTCDKWQKIDSAPKDREILAADSEGVRSVIRWGKHNHVPLYGWLRWERYGEEDVESFEPSYWRELNAAPVGKNCPKCFGVGTLIELNRETREQKRIPCCFCALTNPIENDPAVEGLDFKLSETISTFPNGCDYRLIFDGDRCEMELGCYGVHVNLVQGNARKLLHWFEKNAIEGRAAVNGVFSREDIDACKAKKPCAQCGGYRFLDRSILTRAADEGEE